VLLPVAGLLFANDAPVEIKRGELWNKEAQAAVEAGQKKDGSELPAILKLQSDFPENARALRNLAWAEQKAGNREQAVHFLQLYADMGMTLDPNGQIYKAFSGVRAGAGASASVLDSVPEFKLNEAAVTTGSLVFALSDSNLLAEDIGFDSASRHFFLTSVHQKKILECDSAGRCEDVVHSLPEMPLHALLAIHVDAPRGVLWATTAGMNNETDFRPEYQGQSAVLKFDLRSHRLIERYEPNDAREHALGDMTVASNGDAYISDGTSGDLYVIRHDGGGLKSLVPAGVFVSPQTPALNGDESLLYVPDYVEGIAIIHLKSGSIEWMKSANPTALDGIDGLYWTSGGLIATQNGTSPERIVRFRLNAYDRIDSFHVLEANWRGLGDPTHGVIVGDEFYYIVNSGWDRADDNGVLHEGTPAAIWKMRIAH
jgi:ketosteroid isomerase-like protein